MLRHLLLFLKSHLTVGQGWKETIQKPIRENLKRGGRGKKREGDEKSERKRERERGGRWKRKI